MDILIAADSWGCGEWSYNSGNGSVILHKGLEFYFSECGYNVHNISDGGAANVRILKRMGNLKKKYNYVFFIQTDPLRDLRPYKKFKELNRLDLLIEKQKELIDETYKNLNKLGYSIHCMGGCGKLNLELINKYENLIPFIESIPEFLIPNYSHPDVWFSDWIDLIDDQFTIEELDKLLENKKRQDSLMDEHADLFYPDGHHPNREAHKILFNKINQHINNKQASIV